MLEIRVNPKEAWEFFEQHKESLFGNKLVIAENEDYGAEVFMTIEYELPKILVYLGGVAYHEEIAVSEEDCRKVLEEIYQDYLTGKILDNEDYEEFSKAQIEDLIEEKESEFDEAVIYLIGLAIGEDIEFLGEDADEIVEDVKDHILEYMARKHGLAIQRPMMLEDENGEEFYAEFPYECMEFEDEDNPIYKSE